MSGGDGFQDDDDVDVDGSYHDNDGEDDHNDDHDDDHDGELVKIEISGSGWRDPDEVVWPAAMHIENTHMHSFHSGDDDEVDYDGGAHDDFDSNYIDDYEGSDIYDADDHITIMMMIMITKKMIRMGIMVMMIIIKIMMM